MKIHSIVNRPVLLLCGLLLQALPALGDLRFTTGLLFRVQLETESPSYLFGTMHSDDPAVVQLPLAVEQAFAESQMLVVETSLEPANIMLALAHMVSETEQDLPALLGEPMYRQCLEAARQTGIPETVLPFYRPWALAVLFSTPPMESGRFLDLVLYQRAIQEGKAVEVLETVDEQIGGFAALSLADQVALLKDALNNRSRLPMIYENLKLAYLARDLAGLVALSRDEYQLEDPELHERVEEAMIYARNRRMSERLSSLMPGGGVFVAVGAMHLPGGQGLLALLQDLGFQVEPVY